MNRLFLLIPAVEVIDAGQDIAYLKQLGSIDSEGVLSILRQIVRSFRLVEGEEMEVVYDEKHFKRLFHRTKSKTSPQEMPQLENLLMFFNDAVSIQQLGIGTTPTIINGMRVDGGLVNAFTESRVDGQTLLNKDALNDPGQPIDVRSDNGVQVRLNPLPCEAADVYLWFVENRTPQRKLDSNYKKHRLRERTGKGGVKISALSYTKQQLNEFLKRAVVARKGLRELYFKDNANDKIIIFWDENLESPSYHAMEIASDDVEELQKIYKRGGGRLKERIDDTSNFI